jgi:hypothetical protein
MKKIIPLLLLALMLAGCSSEPQHTLSYVDGKAMEVYDIDCVAVFTQYTNSSSETAIPADYLTVKAFQNGVEIPCLVPTGDKTEGYIQCDASVQSGVTADVVWIFQLEDSSTVSVEFSDGQKFEIPLTEE